MHSCFLLALLLPLYGLCLLIFNSMRLCGTSGQGDLARTKWCLSCLKDTPLDEFARNIKGLFETRSMCKRCKSRNSNYLASQRTSVKPRAAPSTSEQDQEELEQTEEQTEVIDEETVAEHPRRGRPPGSKKKAKDPRAAPPSSTEKTKVTLLAIQHFPTGLLSMKTHCNPGVLQVSGGEARDPIQQANFLKVPQALLKLPAYCNLLLTFPVCAVKFIYPPSGFSAPYPLCLPSPLPGHVENFATFCFIRCNTFRRHT
jgi:hypothetical protein